MQAEFSLEGGVSELGLLEELLGVLAGSCSRGCEPRHSVCYGGQCVSSSSMALANPKRWEMGGWTGENSQLRLDPGIA